jgi:hypothetical protein
MGAVATGRIDPVEAAALGVIRATSVGFSRGVPLLGKSGNVSQGDQVRVLGAVQHSVHVSAPDFSYVALNVLTQVSAPEHIPLGYANARTLIAAQAVNRQVKQFVR